MLLGYVSDETYSALAGVSIAIVGPGVHRGVVSLADGSFHADLPPGDYELTLAAVGHGGKRLALRVAATAAPPVQVRLLSDRLLGYAWPKWIPAGEVGEFRVHSSCAYHLSLWHYGWNQTLVEDLGWFDDHGPRPTRQLPPSVRGCITFTSRMPRGSSSRSPGLCNRRVPRHASAC